VGISATDQKHIFDKFYRVSSGDLAKSRGTGLGLSLVKQLIEQQHGKITVTSELGKGSVFVVYLPLEKGSQNIEVRS
jgi:two-component system phosphate regulon sensor histidine kinase PhoR